MDEPQSVSRSVPYWALRAVLYSQVAGLLALALANYCDRHSRGELAAFVNVSAVGTFGFVMMLLCPVCMVALVVVSTDFRAQVLLLLLTAIWFAQVIAFIPAIQ